MKSDTKRLRLALLGFGNAGRAFAQLLLDHREAIRRRFGIDVVVTAIITGSRGALENGEGLDLQAALDRLEQDGLFLPEDPGYVSLNAMDAVARSEYDVAVELTPLNIFNGQPALDYIRTALGRGKHVITANKGPLAHGARELIGLARSNNVRFLHETTVMDGTPVFNLVEETLPFCTVTGVEGILNTTTNFVLEEMAQGRSLAEAMEEGRRRGFVEADPSLDIDGWDAAAKLTVLMNVLMGAELRPQDIDRTGIGAVTADAVKSAQDAGQVIKLVCRGFLENGAQKGVVAPERLDVTHPYASVSGTSSIVTLHTDLMGSISVTEHDPEIRQTGYGVFSDLIRLLECNRT